MRIPLSLAFAVMFCVAAGCGRKSKFVAGGVYSTQEMSVPVAGSTFGVYGICQVVSVSGSDLVVSVPAQFFEKRPTAVTDFPTNAKTIHIHPSAREFAKKRPMFIGTLPVTASQSQEATP